MTTHTRAPVGLTLPDSAAVDDFCHRWQLAELSLFGSALDESFRPSSDIDVLVTFLPGARIGLLDLFEMEQELAHMFGRPVDIVEPGAVTNPFRRRTMLGHRRVLYAA